MKTKNITFSLPISLVSDIHSLAGKNASQFVTKILTKAIAEQHQLLLKEYEEANNDPDIQKTISDWKDIEVEGWE